MFCPECGYDAAEAKFCPECGSKLDPVREVVRGGPATPVAPSAPASAASGAKTTGGPRRAPRPARDERTGAGGGSQAPRPRSGTNPLYIWIGVAAVAVVVAIVMLVMINGKGSPSSSAANVAPPVADTSGTYAVLLKRANDLFDVGSNLLQNGQPDQQGLGAQYFTAAATVYKAAWAKQPGDPNLATDWSYAIFQSGDLPGAIKKADAVIKANPTFQAAYHHKGLYLMMEAFGASGAQAQQLRSDAKAALEKAISLGAATQFGQEAEQFLQQLETASPAPVTSATP